MNSNILLPWHKLYGIIMRFSADDSSHSYGYFILNGNGYRYNAYDIYDVCVIDKCDTLRVSSSIKEACKIVDNALIKAGWRLLNENDPLLALL
jgi:hypothetical protein